MTAERPFSRTSGGIIILVASSIVVFLTSCGSHGIMAEPETGNALPVLQDTSDTPANGDIGTTNIASLSNEVVFKLADDSNDGSRVISICGVNEPLPEDLPYFYGEVTYDPESVHYQSFCWAEFIQDNPDILTIAMDNGRGSVQFGVCGIHLHPIDLDSNNIASISFQPGSRKCLSTLTASELAANRVPDLEIIFHHDLELGTSPGNDAAELDDIMLTWSYAYHGDHDYNTLISAADLTPIGMYYERKTDHDTAFIPSKNTTYENLDASVFQSAVMHADSNKDGLVNISDMTTIGQNYSNPQYYGWKGYYQQGSSTPVPLVFKYPVPESEDLLESVVRSTDDLSLTNEKLMTPNEQFIQRYQYCRSVDASNSLYTSLPANVNTINSFYLESYLGPFDAITTQTMESLKRKSTFDGISAYVTLSTALIDPSYGAGLIQPVMNTINSYIVLASDPEASIPNALLVYEYDRTTSPPSLIPTPVTSVIIPEITNIQALAAGTFGDGRSLAVLGDASGSTTSTVVLFRLSSGLLAEKLTMEIPFQSNLMLASDVGCTPFTNELLVWPEINSQVYDGTIIEYTAVDTYEQTAMSVGEGSNVAIVDDFVCSTPYGNGYPDHIVSLVSKNEVEADLFSVFELVRVPEVEYVTLPTSSESPLGGLTADYGRSLEGVATWDLSNITQRSFLSSGSLHLGSDNNYYRTITLGYRDLPVFSHWLFEPSINNYGSIALNENSFCLEIYRNLVDCDGNVLDTKVNGLVMCDLQQCGTKDIAYITQDAIGWRIGSEERNLWSDTFSNVETIVEQRPGNFGPVYLLGAEDESIFNPQHIASVALEYVNDPDDIIVTAKTGSTYRLLVVSFETPQQTP